MSYKVLAIRYRSQTFDDVVGQDAIAQTLKNAIKTGRVAHAYLFSGTRGVGKTTMARILAKALNCLNSDEPTTEPCCKCDSCVSVNIGEDIDVIEIDGASNTGVENIRELRQNAIYRPARARYKVYIIDEVHMLSTAAFNALLKILEEPPEHVKFIFATTEPNKVIATIQSRCQRFDFNSITPKCISGQLKKILKAEKIKYEDDLILHLARLANGSMRDGLSLLDQLISTGVSPLSAGLLQEFLGEPDREKICNVLSDIGDNDAGAVLEDVDGMLKGGQTPIQVVDSLIDCMRDLMIARSAGSSSELLILTAGEREKMGKIAEKFDVPGLIYNITTLEKLRWTIKNSDSGRTLLEASLLRLALSEHFMSVPAILSQLQRMPLKSAGPVKKNLIPDSRPIESKKPVDLGGENTKDTTQAVKSSAVLMADTTLESIKTNWERIIQSVCGRDEITGGMLKSACPVEFNGATLKLGFAESEEFVKIRCEKRSERISELLTEAIGTQIRLKFELDSKVVANKSTAGNEVPRVSKQQRDQALTDPAVRAILSGLNATVTDIDELK